MPVVVLGTGRGRRVARGPCTISYGSLLPRVWIRASLFVHRLTADMVPKVPAIGASVSPESCGSAAVVCRAGRPLGVPYEEPGGSAAGHGLLA